MSNASVSTTGLDDLSDLGSYLNFVGGSGLQGSGANANYGSGNSNSSGYNGNYQSVSGNGQQYFSQNQGSSGNYGSSSNSDNSGNSGNYDVGRASGNFSSMPVTSGASGSQSNPYQQISQNTQAQQSSAQVGQQIAGDNAYRNYQYGQATATEANARAMQGAQMAYNMNQAAAGAAANRQAQAQTNQNSYNAQMAANQNTFSLEQLKQQGANQERVAQTQALGNILGSALNSNLGSGQNYFAGQLNYFGGVR